MGNLPKVVAATTNKNKAAELATVGERFGISVVTPSVLGRGAAPDVSETGGSYYENALLKAHAFAQWSGLPAVGDDSGIEIVALDNRPGLYSARYAGLGATDAQRNTKVLEELAELERQTGKGVDRTAYYVCCLVLCDSDGKIIKAESRLSGQILREPRGTKGFGYDPIMILDKLNRTLAEVEFEVTCNEGFRAEAAKELFANYQATLSLANAGR